MEAMHLTPLLKADFPWALTGVRLALSMFFQKSRRRIAIRELARNWGHRAVGRGILRGQKAVGTVGRRTGLVSYLAE